MKTIFLTAIATAVLASMTFPTARPLTSARPVLRGSAIDPATLAVIERSCGSCHSERTAWPWYSRVPPAGWMMATDVNAARAKMNLSHWEEYSAEQKRELLGSIASNVRNARMPLPRYLLLHPEARLSPADAARIQAWTRVERRKPL